MALVSIIIPTYNRTQWLFQAIESAVNQVGCDVEVVVVDDGSENDDARQIAARFPRVIYFYQENKGLGGARNTGLRICTGNFVQFLDDDDFLTGESIVKKYDFLKHNRDFDVVYSDLFLTDASGKVLSNYYARWKRPLPIGDIYQRLVFYNFIPVHAMLWRRDVLLEKGGFPERSMLEDWECLLKIAEESRFGFLDEPLGYYRFHKKSMSSDFHKQTDAFGLIQQKIVSSNRFAELPRGIKALALTKYALKQWADGDPELGKQFVSAARKLAPFTLTTIGLSALTLLDRKITRNFLRLVWRFRSKMQPGALSRDYFLIEK